ncbi:MAG TPA: iron-containing alcohol dehydrogenase [Phycisphaerae bacterium]|nr:iron-containing alcohol dehydrogenase [Phycisphaerae bacterium]
MAAAGEAGGFELLSVGRILFGQGRAAELPDLVRSFGRIALLVTNAGCPGAGGVTDRVAAMLTEAGVRVALYPQRGEPTVAGVAEATETARADGCEVVVGLGGGSAIDTAKAAAALLTNGGGPLDYMEVVGQGRKITRPSAPWVAVPTTAGTGAEVTKNAVVACPERRFKASIRGEQLLARAVVVDPELGLDVPPDVTAQTGMDALCQLIESYTSNRAQPITDALAMAGIRRAARSLRRAFEDGRDADARADMALAALLSGITLTNAGLGAVHGFAAPLGANFPAPHGAICAALLPGVMAANAAALRGESPEHPVLRRYADIGRALTGRAELADEQAVDAGVAAAAQLAKDLKVPPLSEYGLAGGRIDEMVSLARRSSSMRYNPVVLTDEALAGVLRKAL